MIVEIVVALLSGATVPTVGGALVKRLIRDPKRDAEARKIHLETDDGIVARLYREIDRLDKEMNEVRDQLVIVRQHAFEEKQALELENEELRGMISRLEDELRQQRIDFEGKLAEERADCARRLQAMEGKIRQLQQRQASFGNLSTDRLGGALHHAFHPDPENKDRDLIDKLDEVPRKATGGKRKHEK
jgi:regulator of replication initiation timing